ncbi:MAG: cytochrome c3 family protein [Bacillota bacterium]|nr:cytochrome c3 family protein [Bacillota bacterium]
MSKIKISFSLILALLLVGILSSSVFAASDPYKLTPTQVTGTDNVSVTFVSSQAGQSYDMYIYDPSTGKYLTSQTFTGITPSTTPIPTFTGLQAGISYVVKLTLTGGNPDTQAVSSALAAVVDVHSGPMVNATNPTNGDATFDKNGSGLSNANKTGEAPTKKQRAGQKLHGFYQNNTNSCATCHQTHTAANGESLLFKDGTYSTCSACHDGTTGANNSFSPVSASTVNSIDGTFNVQQVDSNGVNHNE